MNTRRFVRSVATLLVLFGLCGFAASLARAGPSDATITVCNQGRIDINVVIGTQTALPLFARNLDVVAWLSIKPAACRQVYPGVGDYATSAGIDRSYLGFGFYKWMTVDASVYSTWNPAGRFRGVVTATDGGGCAVGHHEFLALTP